MDERVRQSVMQGAPTSLTDQELELDRLPLTKTPVPLAGHAWVRYGDVALKVDVEIVAWTPRAVAIRWPVAEGVHRAWVWANAVERGG